MFKKVLLLVLVGLVVAGGSYRQDTRLTLQRSRRNVLNFACGAYGNDGRPTYNGYQPINYSFSGQPSWLSSSGSSLYGTPPITERGPWYVSVNYRGDQVATGSGSSRYELALDDSSNSGYLTTASASVSITQNADPITYSNGYPEGHRTIDASETSYIVLVPILTTNTRTVYEKQPDTVLQQPAVSCTSYENSVSSVTSDLTNAQNDVTTLNSRLTAALALVDSIRTNLTAAQNQVTADQATLNQANTDLSNCRNRQTAAATPIVIPGQTIPHTQTYTTTSYVAVAVGGYSTDNCGSIPVDNRGTGLIITVGSDFVVVAGLGQINFGACTQKSYTRGRNYFNSSDNVSYETYQYGGKRWARRVSCQ